MKFYPMINNTSNLWHSWSHYLTNLQNKINGLDNYYAYYQIAPSCEVDDTYLRKCYIYVDNHPKNINEYEIWIPAVLTYKQYVQSTGDNIYLFWDYNRWDELEAEFLHSTSEYKNNVPVYHLNYDEWVTLTSLQIEIPSNVDEWEFRALHPFFLKEHLVLNAEDNYLWYQDEDNMMHALPWAIVSADNELHMISSLSVFQLYQLPRGYYLESRALREGTIDTLDNPYKYLASSYFMKPILGASYYVFRRRDNNTLYFEWDPHAEEHYGYISDLTLFYFTYRFNVIGENRMNITDPAKVWYNRNVTNNQLMLVNRSNQPWESSLALIEEIYYTTRRSSAVMYEDFFFDYTLEAKTIKRGHQLYHEYHLTNQATINKSNSVELTVNLW